MELPHRDPGDELLRAGELFGLRRRLRAIAPQHDLTTVVACAFDHRTRMLPFIFADMKMAPAGVRAVGAAMADTGFNKTRIVLQQWNRNFRPSQMRLDGRIPDIFMVSSMQIHSAQCRALIRDACRIDVDQRPLIIAGGPKTIYEPWDVFSTDPNDPAGADVAVTGEEYVLLNLLEVLLSIHTPGESLRKTFIRVRNTGMLDDVPGLVYPVTDASGAVLTLVDTGIQRLVADLDELPHPVLGYPLLEAPSRLPTLAAKALPISRIRKVSPIGSLVLTFGCKFACPYCPIPAYNQRKHRVKSGDRIADEMVRLRREFGIGLFFGADDNFFNHRKRTLDILEKLASVRHNLDRSHRFRWATEVTVHDTLQLEKELPIARRAGIRALWIGVEDMTATLIKKGQSVDKTSRCFQLLKDHGICPMPMMMHHDTQPLYTPGRPYGLINQARLLRKAGAVSLQVLMISPATGSKLYEEAFTSSLAYKRVNGRKVDNYMRDGNYVIASEHKKPWRKQFNIMIAYLYFYNPLRFLYALVRPNTRVYFADSGMQLFGMYGLLQTARRTFGWAMGLMRGNIERETAIPTSSIPMRSVDHTPACHALAGTPTTAVAQPPEATRITPEA